MQEKTMTHDLAAALLRDVRRYEPDNAPCMQPALDGDWLSRAEVLAALSRALDPALTERAGEVLEGCLQAVEAGEGPYRHDWRDKPHKLVYDLTKQITDLLAQNAALRAQIDTMIDADTVQKMLDSAQPIMAEACASYEEANRELEAERDALRAERDDAVIKRAAWELEAKMQKARAEAAEAKVEKLRGERDALEKHIEDTAKDTHKLLVAAEAKVEKLREALRGMPSVVRHTTVCQGPSWPDDRPGVWIAALTACENAVQEAVDAALTTEADNG